MLHFSDGADVIYIYIYSDKHVRYAEVLIPLSLLPTRQLEVFALDLACHQNW